MLGGGAQRPARSGTGPAEGHLALSRAAHGRAAPGHTFATPGAAIYPFARLIAFTSDRDGNFEIYVMNADGTDQRRLTNNPAEDVVPAWGP
ncbi:MAG: PD40 domain-containing protein [Chloroflexi bacterium]|nr:PD40 domain-containing protein [Chloroflexota bacterium]